MDIIRWQRCRCQICVGRGRRTFTDVEHLLAFVDGGLCALEYAARWLEVLRELGVRRWKRVRVEVLHDGRVEHGLLRAMDRGVV